MNQPIPTGPDRFGFAEADHDKARQYEYGDPEEAYHRQAAQYHATQAQTAVLVMLVEVIANATGTDHDDLDAWREKIGLTWLKECRSFTQRRPQCAEQHTDDCDYANNRVQPHPEQPPAEEPISEPDPALTSLLARFERKWSCEVFRTGYHNGDECGPSDPHGGWNCGYVWAFPLLTDKGAREIGLITDSTKED
jgi:hypothetical protein